MKSSISVGDKPNHSGAYGKHMELSTKIVTAEARAWLFRQLIRNKLATPDIYHFSRKQAQIRIIDKDPDIRTIKASMAAKLRDTKKHLYSLHMMRRNTERMFRTDNPGKNFKIRKMKKRIKSETQLLKDKVLETYKMKIKHYSKKQACTGSCDIKPTNKRQDFSYAPPSIVEHR